ncbi:hypothetical protein GGI01_001069 [Coemansia sp. RSA 376]|nr:hypothetical protein GGI01_001069 [Coemansia sp. RSA 376]
MDSGRARTNAHIDKPSTSGLAASTHGSVCGGDILMGESSWESFVRDNRKMVDKSLSIKRVMTYGADVMIGLAPRKSGKSTFVSMLASFLATNSSTMTLADRRRHFEKSDLFRQHPTFFNDHFAKYPVFVLNFSRSMPLTTEEAISILRGNVIIAYKDCIEYLGSLPNTLQGDNLGRFESAADSSITGDDCGDFLKALMEVLYNCFDGRGSVVTIDEYDKPIFCAPRELGIGKEACKDIVGVYSQFYSALFKNNPYLRLGLLVGVFKVPLSGVFSGDSDTKVFQAHTGLFSEKLCTNPFDVAFNLTAAEVYCLVCDHVKQHDPNKFATGVDLFKRELLAFCFKHFDGYVYGQQRFIFNIHAIMSFFHDTRESVSIDIIKPAGEKPYWTRVGSLSMIRSLRAKDASLFRMYANRLINEYYLRSAYQYGNMSTKGALESRILSEKTGLAMFNDVAYSHEANQSFGIDTASLDKLAKVCFNAQIDDYQNWSNENLAAETAFSLLYQAGYLTPLPNGHVGIPNRDVFSEFESLIACL